MKSGLYSFRASSTSASARATSAAAASSSGPRVESTGAEDGERRRDLRGTRQRDFGDGGPLGAVAQGIERSHEGRAACGDVEPPIVVLGDLGLELDDTLLDAHPRGVAGAGELLVVDQRVTVRLHHPPEGVQIRDLVAEPAHFGDQVETASAHVRHQRVGLAEGGLLAKAPLPGPGQALREGRYQALGAHAGLGRGEVAGDPDHGVGQGLGLWGLLQAGAGHCSGRRHGRVAREAVAHELAHGGILDRVDHTAGGVRR